MVTVLLVQQAGKGCRGENGQQPVPSGVGYEAHIFINLMNIQFRLALVQLDKIPGERERERETSVA